jgi:hypothetical protein
LNMKNREKQTRALLAFDELCDELGIPFAQVEGAQNG